jgi:hypothetical protein
VECTDYVNFVIEGENLIKRDFPNIELQIDNVIYSLPMSYFFYQYSSSNWELKNRSRGDVARLGVGFFKEYYTVYDMSRN